VERPDVCACPPIVAAPAEPPRRTVAPSWQLGPYRAQIVPLENPGPDGPPYVVEIVREAEQAAADADAVTTYEEHLGDGIVRRIALRPGVREEVFEVPGRPASRVEVRESLFGFPVVYTAQTTEDMLAGDVDDVPPPEPREDQLFFVGPTPESSAVIQGIDWGAGDDHSALVPVLSEQAVRAVADEMARVTRRVLPGMGRRRRGGLRGGEV